MNNFAAIDFETANECPCSICSVGVVIVRDGEIVDSYYSLINPEPNYYKWFADRSTDFVTRTLMMRPFFPRFGMR